MTRTCRHVWLLVGCAWLAVGCQQQMADQPSYRPLESSSFFEDGRASRPLVAGVVARGQFDDEAYAFLRFRRDRAQAIEAASLVGFAVGPTATMAMAPAEIAAVANYVAEIPFPISAALLHRGQQRYTIFCAVCHGPDGTGNGPIIQRGYTRPPSFTDGASRSFERRGWMAPLRKLPAGYYVAVMTEGYGAMASYAAQVSPADRWAIAAYVRALQLSQYARLEDLPEQQRRTALKALEGEK